MADIPSNTITVTNGTLTPYITSTVVSTTEITYTTVVGNTLTITANYIPGKRFTKWTSTSLTFTDETAETTTVTPPSLEGSIYSITATYTDLNYLDKDGLTTLVANIKNELATRDSEINALLDQIPTATATGETINVQDSSNLPIKDFAMLGNATQADTPTPDSPQDIHVITGDNTLKVVGKNLCNTILTVNLNSGNERWISTSLTTENSGIRWENGKTYYIGAFCEKQSNETVQIDNYGYNTIINTTKTITFNGTIPRVRVGANSLQANIVNEEVKIIVAYNSFTEYEPYTAQTQLLSLGNIELAKIGTYTDRIYKSGGKWYVEKNIGKVTIDTNAYVSYNGASDTPTPRTVFVAYRTTPKITNYYSNYFLFGSTTSNRLILTANDTIYYISLDNQILGITASDTSEVKTNKFQNWLSDNTIDVQIVLATPTTTEITDTTLISQLENILKMHTNKNVTNAWIEPTGTNAQAGIELAYRQDEQTLFNNLKNAILSLGGNV